MNQYLSCTGVLADLQPPILAFQNPIGAHAAIVAARSPYIRQKLLPLQKGNKEDEVCLVFINHFCTLSLFNDFISYYFKLVNSFYH